MDGIGRRDVCRIGATGALAVTGIGSVTGANGRSSQSDSAGKLVFIYDDGPAVDYTQTFPVHQEEGVPACCAAVSDRIGSGALTPEQLREMEDEGWEIMSHTKSHVLVGNLYLTEPADPNSQRVYVNGGMLADKGGQEIVLGQGDRTVENVVAGGGTDGTGRYLDLEEPVGESFDAEDGFLRVSDERVREEVVGSKEDLEDLGVDVDAFVAPFGRSEGLLEDLVREHYVAYTNHGKTVENPLWNFDRYELGRFSFDTRNAERGEIEGFLDQVARGDLLGLMVAHSRYPETTAERIRFAIREAKARDLEIVTLREALKDIDAWPDDEETEVEAKTGAETETEDGTSADSSAVGDRVDAVVEDTSPSVLAGVGTGAIAAAALAGREVYRRVGGGSNRN